MKKTLFLLFCAAVSFLIAWSRAPVSEWEGFTPDGAAMTGGLVFHFGASSVDSGGTLNVAASSSLANRPTVDLSSAGLSLYHGLTISLEVKGAAAGGNLLGLASPRNGHLFAAGTDENAHGLFLFDGNGNNGGNTGNTASLGVTSPTVASIITITAGWDGSNVVFKMYENGRLVASGQANNSTMARQELNKLALGGWAGSSGDRITKENVSRLAIYDRAMTAEEVQAACMAWTVPEPATAALGLLGLGALLLLRRRH